MIYSYVQTESAIYVDYLGPRGEICKQQVLPPIEPIAFANNGTNFSTGFEPLRGELDEEWK